MLRPASTCRSRASVSCLSFRPLSDTVATFPAALTLAPWAGQDHGARHGPVTEVRRGEQP